MNQSAQPVYCFGPFHYDSAQRLLFREDEMVPLAPKLSETLRVLLERHGRVVEKAELMREVWPDTTVEEVGLARNISQLRKALGDESEAGTYIETLPKRGYRFVGEVVTDGGGNGKRAGAKKAISPIRRLRTVLPAAGVAVRYAGVDLLAVLPAVALSFLGRADCPRRGCAIRVPEPGAGLLRFSSRPDGFAGGSPVADSITFMCYRSPRSTGSSAPGCPCPSWPGFWPRT